jgi:hypothetical protein
LAARWKPQSCRLALEIQVESAGQHGFGPVPVDEHEERCYAILEVQLLFGIHLGAIW